MNEQLKNAMIGCLAHTPNRALMIAFLSVGEKPNQRELVALLRMFVKIRPAANHDQLQLALELMRYVARHGLKTEFPDEVGAVAGQFDYTLCQATHGGLPNTMRLMAFAKLMWLHDVGLLGGWGWTGEVGQVAHAKAENVRESLSKYIAFYFRFARVWANVLENMLSEICFTSILEKWRLGALDRRRRRRRHERTP